MSADQDNFGATENVFDNPLSCDTHVSSEAPSHFEEPWLYDERRELFVCISVMMGVSCVISQQET